MLVLILHNDSKYLQSLATLAKKKGINGVTVIKQEGIGTTIKGCSSDMIFHSGRIDSEYDKALVGVTSQAKADDFLQGIKKEASSGLLPAEEEGFMCTVPFSQINRVTDSLQGLKPENQQSRAKPASKVQSPPPKTEKDEIQITDFLSVERISPDLKPENKDDAIKKLVGLMEGNDNITDIQKFEKDVMYRESLASTAIGKKCAIPHSRSDTVRDIVLAFGRCSEGVDFGDESGEPVKFIFLAAVPQEKEKLNIYLRLLAILSKKLDDKAVRNSLLEAESREEIFEIFSVFESVKVKTEAQ